MKCLFEDFENQPTELKEVTDKWNPILERGTDYRELEKMLQEVEAIGYTFDFGLDNEPFGLRPIGTKLEELEGFED